MKAARLAVLAALLAQTGLPYALGQACAWASMVRSGQTVAQAVQGRKPCGLCLKLRAAKSAGAITVAPASVDWQAASAFGIQIRESASPATTFSPSSGPSFDASFDPPPPRSALS